MRKMMAKSFYSGSILDIMSYSRKVSDCQMSITDYKVRTQKDKRKEQGWDKWLRKRKKEK